MRYSLPILWSALFASMAATNAEAEIIMTIDIQNPSTAIFVATDAPSEITLGPIDAFLGITFDGLLDGNTIGQNDLFFGNLSVLDSAVGATRDLLFITFVSAFAGGYTFDDLAVYSGDFNMYFDTTEPALSGFAIHDLTTFDGLAPVGTVGNVYAGTPDQLQIIGQYRVVATPEPASIVLCSMLALGPAVAFRSFRKR